MVAVNHQKVWNAKDANETVLLSDMAHLATKMLQIKTAGFSGTLDIKGSLDGVNYINVRYVELTGDGGIAVINDQLSYVLQTTTKVYMLAEWWPHVQLVMTRSAGTITLDAWGHEASPFFFPEDALAAGSALLGTVAIDQTTDGTTNKVRAFQPTHDNLNANANIQVGDADVSATNTVPVRDATTVSAIVVHRENVTAEDASKGPDNDNASWAANPGGRKYFIGHVYAAYRTDATLTLTIRPWLRDPASFYISRADAKVFDVPDVTPEVDDAGTNMTATANNMTDTSPGDYTNYKANNSIADYYIADDNEGIGWVGGGGGITVMNVFTTPRLNSAGWAVGGTPTNGGPYEIRKAVPFTVIVEADGLDVFLAVEAVGGTEGAFTASIYGVWV